MAGGTLQEVMEYQSSLSPNDRSGATYLAAVDRSLRERGESADAGSAVRLKFQRAAWPEVVCWLGARLASALAGSHQRGNLHRDIRPSNVLIDPDGSPKLTDGSAGFETKPDESTLAAACADNLAYLAPEQLEVCNPAEVRQPEDLDGRCDVYSLGIVLWELLTGSRPFQEEAISDNWSQTLTNMAAQRRSGVGTDSITRLPFNCPAGLRQILLSCLAGNRENRCPSAADMARQLELCLQPHAQWLLELPGDTWRNVPRRFPVTSLILGGLVPNGVMSGLNIAYNWTQIVPKMQDADRHEFVFLLLAVNAIAYAWGTIWALYLSWPVVVAMWEVTGGGRNRWRPATPHWLPSLRARTLRLGEYAAWVSAVDWAFSGFVIPTWVRAQAGDHAAMLTKDYVHFAVSQALCGLVATTLTYFLVTLVALRACYPRLIAPATDMGMPDDTTPNPAVGRDAEQLRSLVRRVWLYLGLAVTGPLLAAAVLVGLDDGKAAIGGLGIAGLVGFGVSLWLAWVVRNDAAALAIASQPAGAMLANERGLPESFSTRAAPG